MAPGCLMANRLPEHLGRHIDRGKYIEAEDSVRETERKEVRAYHVRCAAGAVLQP